ncbi:MAG: hypothetical protein JXX29_08090 [Deltaproteobacteria bacterium]|nr:hypothetical protein [Deltaproteobacteria bacterium]MBN2671619.1 hypothetical protein [Deltaproteobacteria bacterium]
MSSIQKLNGLIAQLEQGGDNTRLYAAKAAFNFKHSWLEMAQALVEAHAANRFVEWGYDTFLDYCDRELGLKKNIVDKLMVSFQMLQQHAPQKLDQISEDETMPSYQALDYYARATGELRIDGCPPSDAPGYDLSPELNQQLYDAVFEQGCTPKQLKERFDPVLRPKSPTKEQQDHAKKTISTTRKLLEQLDELEGISHDTIENTRRAVTRLYEEMDQLLTDLDNVLAAEQDIR